MNLLLDSAPFEHIEVVQEPGTGLRACIAIHNTARGPAFGGCRLWAYRDDQKAIEDATRLAEVMSYKNALADLPFGGGKAVILRPDKIPDREALFKSFGRQVERLGGRYITAEDVGTTPDDMRAVRLETRYVSGISRDNQFGGDPSRFTALGVYLAIDTAVRLLLKRRSLRDTSIAVQGVGAVGSQLCDLLAKAGAQLWIADVDPLRAAVVANRCGAHLVSNRTILNMELDVFAPSAIGGVLDASAIEGLKAKIVAGAANNQLAALEDGDLLHERGIWYLPDFLVNAGGMISVAHEYLGTGTEDDVLRDVERIAYRVEQLIHDVRQTKIPPTRRALSWAKAQMSQTPSPLGKHCSSPSPLGEGRGEGKCPS